METFSALLALCAGNSPVPGEFPPQRLVTRSFDVSFDLRPNKWLSKQWWGWWFETPSCPLWRHCNVPLLFGILTKCLLVRDRTTKIEENREYGPYYLLYDFIVPRDPFGYGLSQWETTLQFNVVSLLLSIYPERSLCTSYGAFQKRLRTLKYEVC